MRPEAGPPPSATLGHRIQFHVVFFLGVLFGEIGAMILRPFR